MWRAAAWTAGLFGAGVAVSQVFPAAWAEPLILFGLGSAMLFVSRSNPRPRRTRTVAAKQAAA